MKQHARILKKYLKLLCGVKDKEPLPPPNLPYFQEGDRVGPKVPKSVARVGESVVRLNQDGTVSSFDGKVLTMGDMGAQADQRNAPRLGGLGVGLMQQDLLGQALAAQQQQQQASQGLLDALGSQQAGIALKGLLGSIFNTGPGDIVFSPGPTLSEPKPEREIPIQEPVGKRRIKLRD